MGYGLRQGTTTAERQVAIAIGYVLKRLRDECFTGNISERGEDCIIHHTGGMDLAIHHIFAGLRKIGHGRADIRL